MRLSSLLLTVAIAATLATPMQADQRGDCIARCAAIAEPCGQTARATADTCMATARAACDKVAMAEKFNCLRAAATSCSGERHSAGEACLAGFKSCHAACGPAPAGRTDFWCESERQTPGKDRYAFTFCAGTAGLTGEDQAKECGRRISRTVPGVTSLSCDQVN